MASSWRRWLPCRAKTDSLARSMLCWIIMCGFWGLMLHKVSYQITEFCIEKQTPPLMPNAPTKPLRINSKFQEVQVDPLMNLKHKSIQIVDSKQDEPKHHNNIAHQDDVDRGHLFRQRGETLKNLPDSNEDENVLIGKLNTTKPVNPDNILNDGMPINSAEIKACEFYFREGELQRKVVPFFRRATIQKSNDITMVTHFSIDRLATFDLDLLFWPGPVSVALYVPTQNMSFVDKQLSPHHRINNRSDISIHLVVKAGNIYPSNFLRNTAMKYSETEFVFLTDVDFVPSRQLYEHVTNRLSKRALPRNQTFVIPAFEKVSKHSGVSFAKADLLRLWRERGVSFIRPFHSTSFIRGHFSTNYTKWRTAQKPYFVGYVEGYEPYIIARKSDLPEFYNPLVGRYWDKSSHSFLLHVQRFRFLVLPQVFLVHLSHKTEVEFAPYRNCAKIVYVKYRKAIKSQDYKQFQS